MPQNAIIYRVLVASPSDCVEERKLVPEVLYGWNAAHSLSQGAILEPVLWETHARPEMGNRPQALINDQLVQHCDIVVGTFWTRLGTSTGVAVSGTAEEIEQFRSLGKTVLLYFSSAPVVPESLDPAQYQALNEYRRTLQTSGLYFSYDSIDQLRRHLQQHIASTMAHLHNASSNVMSPEPEPTDDATAFKSQFETFLRRLEAEWASERDSNPHGIDDGKDICNGALTDVLSFRSQIVSGLQTVSSVLDEVARDLRGIQRHRLYLDGGASIRDFFLMGDSIIEKLRRIPSLIDQEIRTGHGD